MRHRTLAFLFLAWGGGCHNSCQALCVRLANVVETDCGITVPAEDLAECIEQQAGSESRDDRKTCRTSNAKSEIRDEWTCEDMAYFIGAAAPADGPTQETTTE
jgi:hypothetical protein